MHIDDLSEILYRFWNTELVINPNERIINISNDEINVVPSKEIARIIADVLGHGVKLTTDRYGYHGNKKAYEKRRGFTNHNGDYFNDKEIKFLMDNYYNSEKEFLIKKTGRTWCSIQHKATRLSLKRNPKNVVKSNILKFYFICLYFCVLTQKIINFFLQNIFFYTFHHLWGFFIKFTNFFIL